jgi:hypothetical protein
MAGSKHAKLKEKDQKLRDAINKRLAAGDRPGRNVQWERFCDEVRKICGAEATDRGFGDRSIKRLYNRISKQDKSDKHVDRIVDGGEF